MYSMHNMNNSTTYRHSPGLSHLPWVGWQPSLQTAVKRRKLGYLKHISTTCYHCGISNTMLHTFFAIVALPAGEAALVAGAGAGVVPELVVTRPAEGGARGVVVVGLAGDAHAVRDGGRGARVAQRVPLRARLHDARPPRFFDQPRLFYRYSYF